MDDKFSDAKNLLPQGFGGGPETRHEAPSGVVSKEGAGWPPPPVGARAPIDPDNIFKLTNSKC